ncbi:MAG: ATP-binding protein [Bacteroidota bacterium]
MEILFELSHKKIQSVRTSFTRGLLQKIAWNARLIGIKGSRGVGKTTLLLQYLKQNLSVHPNSLYVSLDHLWFTDHSLISLVDYFVKHGGTLLCVDEVHKYPNWSQEIKNIYDDYPELSVVFTGSSLLEILNARADLSRRAVMYYLPGLSFREYLEFVTGKSFPIFTLEQILVNHVSLSQEIVQLTKPLAHFKTYLAYGYYPFFKEMPELYHTKVNEVINLILEIELPLLRGIDVAYIRKLKQMLVIIGESVPFIPNISKLSERIGINRQTFLSYLHYLEEIELITLLHRNSSGITRLQKPDKIYLNNPNLAYSIVGNTPNIGNVRETFFLNQIKQNNTVTLPDSGDFFIDNTYLIEIGGAHKTNKQIANQKQAYIAMDEIEQGFANKIPLWLFGFMH